MTPSFKKRFKRIEWKLFLWNIIGWFFLLFGLFDTLLFHRLAGVLAIVGGVSVLIINWMKKGNWGIFEPKPKMSKKVTDKVTVQDEGVTLRDILALVIMIAIGLTIIYFAWGWHSGVDKAMLQNCKHCSWGQKDCQYTEKELMDQEMNDGICGDMGYYEVMWKVSFAAIFVGIIPIFLSIADVIPWLRKRVFVEEFNSQKAEKKAQKLKR